MTSAQPRQSAGSAGSAGSTGATGSAGSAGATGSAGSAGSARSTGATGSAGSTGTTGTTGSAGCGASSGSDDAMRCSHRSASRSYPALPISSVSSGRYERNTGSPAPCAEVAEVHHQCRSWPPGPQPRRSYSPMVIRSTRVSSGRSIQS
ncbi:hypothetical protein GWI24_26170 [Streptomyces sp. MK37H]|nr:hypothetical protein [Streptomyces sp. MK37H]